MRNTSQRTWPLGLPHVDQAGLIQSITFRLADSIPAKLRQEWLDELRLAKRNSENEHRLRELARRIEEYSDSGHGECLLKQPEAAQIVADALKYFDGLRYTLVAWCVMPNHVHAIIVTIEEWPLESIAHSWKSYTAKEINKLVKRSGELWMSDYFDRFIRDDDHLASSIAYVENNPVKAGLIIAATDWTFSSAHKRTV